jgi:hypothetical protein
VVLTDDGKLDISTLCPAHLMELAQEKVDTVLCADAETAKQLPFYVDVRCVEKALAGSNVVRAADAADQVGTVPPMVCTLTREENAEGIGYNGSVPFVVGGQRRRPRVRGTWFEVPKTGKMVRVWADATGVSRRLQKQLKKTNKRAGREVVAPSIIKKMTSKV